MACGPASMLLVRDGAAASKSPSPSSCRGRPRGSAWLPREAWPAQRKEKIYLGSAGTKDSLNQGLPGEGGGWARILQRLPRSSGCLESSGPWCSAGGVALPETWGC